MADITKDDLVVLDKSAVPIDNFAVKIGDIYLPLFNREGSGFYLCSYVNRNYFSYDKIVVSGVATDLFVGATYINSNWESVALPEDVAARDPNGIYTLTNPDATSVSSFIWQSENGCIIGQDSMNGGIALNPGTEYMGTNKMKINSYEATYPVPEEYNTSYDWVDGDYNSLSGVSVVIPEPAAVEQYWEGYRVRSSDGKWYYESEVTRLTYGDFMPVAGRIYDAGCSMEITNVDLTENALWSCPHGMIFNENDEWVVTASSYYDDRYPWKAFDGDMNTVWNTATEASWIQWQNKLRKVLIKELWIYCDNYMQWNTDCYLQGSDDGVTWTDLRRGVFAGLVSGDHVYEDGFVKVIVQLPDNGKAYYYHRIGHSSANTSGFARKIVARPQFDREVPK